MMNKDVIMKLVYCNFFKSDDIIYSQLVNPFPYFLQKREELFWWTQKSCSHSTSPPPIMDFSTIFT